MDNWFSEDNFLLNYKNLPKYPCTWGHLNSPPSRRALREPSSLSQKDKKPATFEKERAAGGDARAAQQTCSKGQLLRASSQFAIRLGDGQISLQLPKSGKLWICILLGSKSRKLSNKKKHARWMTTWLQNSGSRTLVRDLCDPWQRPWSPACASAPRSPISCT